jgi:hypothetical protein
MVSDEVTVISAVTTTVRINTPLACYDLDLYLHKDSSHKLIYSWLQFLVILQYILINTLHSSEAQLYIFFDGY